ncbi:MAG: siderophore-iron reductase FhuF [Gemmatimonadota bacterium]
MEALSAIFTGSLARYRNAFVFSETDRQCVPAVDLLQPDSFDRIVAPFVARHPGADRRAVISFWTQWYFGILIPPAVAANLLLDVDLPLALDEVGVLLHEEEHRPTGFRLPSVGRKLEPDADAFQRFHRLVGLHVEPLVDAVARTSGLAARLVWSNAGNYFDWIVRELEEGKHTHERDPGGRDGRGDEGAASIGMRHLGSRLRPDGSKNPLFQPVRPVEQDGEEVLQRRICCLRYLLPGIAACGDRCPLEHVT